MQPFTARIPDADLAGPRRRPRRQQGELTAMSEHTWNVITDSLGLLRNAAALISDANAGAPTPCSAWTVAQVFQHAMGDQLAWAAAIGVGTGPAENPFTPSGVLEGGAGELIEPAPALPPRAEDGHAAELLRYLGRDSQWG